MFTPNILKSLIYLTSLSLFSDSMFKSTLYPNFAIKSNIINSFIDNFENSGENYGNQKRNSLKLFKLDEITINVKSFKVPNLINQIAYRFFRKSKAQRSYEYGQKLLDLGIGTPQPIGYYEFQSTFLFGKSYYVSEHLKYDLTYRELTKDLNYPNHEIILRAFTQFTFELHEKGIHFLDHSPGNTLIKEDSKGNYHFYLVDLNRMEFKELDFKTRMKNFARLTKHPKLIAIMSDEYAKLSQLDVEHVNKTMQYYVDEFQAKFQRKKELKQKLKN